MAKVFINPGHDPATLAGTDGYDPGACGCGLQENLVAADIGALVAKYLEAAGCEVMLLQDESLSGIVDASDDYGADVFVSIHCNAFNGEAHGTETHAYFNSADGVELAECINRQIVDSIDIVDRGVRTSGFYVIRWTAAPAVLVETAFIDNPGDAELLRTQTDEFARAIARGVTDYLG